MLKNKLYLKLAGVNSDGVTPDPIPNSEVKPVSGDGTAGEPLWKSSTMPALFFNPIERSGFFLPLQHDK